MVAVGFVSGLLCLFLLFLFAWGSRDRLGSAPPVGDPRLVNVLYATNRVIHFSAQNVVKRFSSERSGDLTYGTAAVRVPEKHRLGVVERPRQQSFLGFRLWTEEEKDTDHFILSEVRVLNLEQFATAIKQNESSTALLFVHGFKPRRIQRARIPYRKVLRQVPAQDRPYGGNIQ
jgi:hypothetical protein